MFYNNVANQQRYGVSGIAVKSVELTRMTANSAEQIRMHAVESTEMRDCVPGSFFKTLSRDGLIPTSAVTDN
jgi:hypothetical protein